MVHRKSEYQNEFKSSIVKNHQPTYLENLTFRHNRRDREFVHTPICWNVDEEQEESSDNEENCPGKTSTKKSNEPQYQSLAEILAESSKKNEAFRKNKVKVDGELDLGRISFDSEENENNNNVPRIEFPQSEYLDDAVDPDNNKKASNKPTETYICPGKKGFVGSDEEDDVDEESKLIEKKKSHTSNVRSLKSIKQPSHAPSKSSEHQSVKGTGKPRRPDRHGVIPSGTCRLRSTVSSSMDKPPFMSYGVGDREPTLAVHRTHNVRSSTDVYAQALKAHRMREAEKRRRQKGKKRAIKSANALLEKLATVTPRDSQSWQSEYRKQFHGYEPQEYERAMSSRAVISRSTPINAVHRGNCLIVHVD